MMGFKPVVIFSSYEIKTVLQSNLDFLSYFTRDIALPAVRTLALALRANQPFDSDKILKALVKDYNQALHSHQNLPARLPSHAQLQLSFNQFLANRKSGETAYPILLAALQKLIPADRKNYITETFILLLIIELLKAHSPPKKTDPETLRAILAEYYAYLDNYVLRDVVRNGYVIHQNATSEWYRPKNKGPNTPKPEQRALVNAALRSKYNALTEDDLIFIHCMAYQHVWLDAGVIFHSLFLENKKLQQDMKSISTGMIPTQIVLNDQGQLDCVILSIMFSDTKAIPREDNIECFDHILDPKAFIYFVVKPLPDPHHLTQPGTLRFNLTEFGAYADPEYHFVFEPWINHIRPLQQHSFAKRCFHELREHTGQVAIASITTAIVTGGIIIGLYYVLPLITAITFPPALPLAMLFAVAGIAFGTILISTLLASFAVVLKHAFVKSPLDASKLCQQTYQLKNTEQFTEIDLHIKEPLASTLVTKSKEEHMTEYLTDEIDAPPAMAPAKKSA